MGASVMEVGMTGVGVAGVTRRAMRAKMGVLSWQHRRKLAGESIADGCFREGKEREGGGAKGGGLFMLGRGRGRGGDEDVQDGGGGVDLRGHLIRGTTFCVGVTSKQDCSSVFPEEDEEDEDDEEERRREVSSVLS